MIEGGLTNREVAREVLAAPQYVGQVLRRVERQVSGRLRRSDRRRLGAVLGLEQYLDVS